MRPGLKPKDSVPRISWRVVWLTALYSLGSWDTSESSKAAASWLAPGVALMVDEEVLENCEQVAEVESRDS